MDGPVLWLNWIERSDDEPGFETGWYGVPGEALLAVHPRLSDPLIDLRTLRNGDAAELVIQRDSGGGKRRILSFRDMSRSPSVPLSSPVTGGDAMRERVSEKMMVKPSPGVYN